MQWNKGYSAEFYAEILDPITWEGIKRIEIIGGTIDRTTEGLLESASIKLKKNIEEKWIRIWMNTRQEDSGSHEPLFTGLISIPERTLIGSREEYVADCFSVLKPAEDILLDRGYYAPANIQVGSIIKSLLWQCPSPFKCSNKITLKNPIIAEESETALSMINKILKVANSKLIISGKGEIEMVSSNETEIKVTFEPVINDVIELNIKDKKDWYKCPNVFRAVMNGLVAVAKDESKGKLSISSRNREIWMEETDCNLSNGESLTEYAMRRLAEEQKIGRELNYTRRYDPRIKPGNLIRMNYPAQNLFGCFKVKNQTVEIGHNCKTNEASEEVI